MPVPAWAGIVAGVVMQIFSYYDRRGCMYFTLSEARKALREALKDDPNGVQAFEYWSKEERRAKRAYIKRVSGSGVVRWFGLY